MSLKRLPSGTSDPNTPYIPPQRPSNTRGNSPYGDPAASPPRRGYTPPSYPYPRRTRSPQRNEIVEAVPDPSNPDFFAPSESISVARPQPATGGGGKGLPPKNRGYAQAENPLPPRHPNMPRNAAAHEEIVNSVSELFTKQVGIKRVIVGGIALEGKTGLHIYAYINLKVLGGLLFSALSAGSVLGYIDIASVEKLRHVYETFVQLLF